MRRRLGDTWGLQASQDKRGASSARHTQLHLLGTTNSVSYALKFAGESLSQKTTRSTSNSNTSSNRGNMQQRPVFDTHSVGELHVSGANSDAHTVPPPPIIGMGMQPLPMMDSNVAHAFNASRRGSDKEVRGSMSNFTSPTVEEDNSTEERTSNVLPPSQSRHREISGRRRSPSSISSKNSSAPSGNAGSDNAANSNHGDRKITSQPASIPATKEGDSFHGGSNRINCSNVSHTVWHVFNSNHVAGTDSDSSPRSDAAEGPLSAVNVSCHKERKNNESTSESTSSAHHSTYPEPSKVNSTGMSVEPTGTHRANNSSVEAKQYLTSTLPPLLNSTPRLPHHTKENGAKSAEHSTLPHSPMINNTTPIPQSTGNSIAKGSTFPFPSALNSTPSRRYHINTKSAEQPNQSARYPSPTVNKTPASLQPTANSSEVRTNSSVMPVPPVIWSPAEQNGNANVSTPWPNKSTSPAPSNSNSSPASLQPFDNFNDTKKANSSAPSFSPFVNQTPATWPGVENISIQLPNHSSPSMNNSPAKFQPFRKFNDTEEANSSTSSFPPSVNRTQATQPDIDNTSFQWPNNSSPIVNSSPASVQTIGNYSSKQDNSAALPFPPFDDRRNSSETGTNKSVWKTPPSIIGQPLDNSTAQTENTDETSNSSSTYSAGSHVTRPSPYPWSITQDNNSNASQISLEPPPVSTSYNASLVADACAVPGLYNIYRYAEDLAERGAMDGNLDGTNTSSNAQRVMRILPMEVFNELFPLANQGRGPSDPQGPYNYSNFIAAVGRFKYFCGEANQTDEVCRLELAALFALFQDGTSHNSAQNTTLDSWKKGLFYATQPGCTDEGPSCMYRTQCDNRSWVGQKYPCQDGQKYFGRGAKPLLGSREYGEFSKVAYGDVHVLLDDPGLLARDGWTAFASAIWFYMTPHPPMPSMHDVVTGRWRPNSFDTAAGRSQNLGVLSLVAIGNGSSCDDSPQVSTRALTFENNIFNLGLFLGISVNADTTCMGLQPFTEASSSAVALNWVSNWGNVCQLSRAESSCSIMDNPADAAQTYYECQQCNKGCEAIIEAPPPTACSNCSACVSLGAALGATDEECKPCAEGLQTFWPCDVSGLCGCVST